MGSSDEDTDQSSICDKFERDRHVFFFQMMYQMLPTEYQGQEINRLTLAYFVISGLHLLGDLACVDKEAVIEWVLSFQAHPQDKTAMSHGEFYGFCGSRTSQFPPIDNGVLSRNCSHLASTYSALSILKIIGFDFSKLGAATILTSMKNLQQPDGSFMPIHIGAEMDVRFIYCAAAICSMLNDWSGMDRQRAMEYIAKCQSYDGGFGLVPGSESHGGATYCAVASLQLMGFIEDDFLLTTQSASIINFPLLLEWSLQRQSDDGGYQGRSNKDSDTCYAFWIGGTLKILGAQEFMDRKALHDFLLTCQTQYGGFSKFPSNLPDLYHSYYGISAFSLLGEPGLTPLCVELGIGDIAPQPQ
uniref:Geranylgeranyl transferase type-1 subunit beta n=1 Tax=Kalanchoe fedtschenkoi TaxID=63787 RepID=A0A7N0V576_KALFE